jgi:2-(1,2-epoxy-1,2-dihydrophenyl)acetyl-CoA isomerase
LVEAGREVVTVIRDTPKPVIAAINGPAAGGGANLALSCDFRIASDKATLGQTFNRIGLHPDWGGTFFLPRLVGAAKALELVFGADLITADEAYEIGLVTKVVPHDTLLAETEALARRLAAKPPLAVAKAKCAIYASERHSLDEMLTVELENQLACFASADAREGLAAFLEKRDPVFRGR